MNVWIVFDCLLVCGLFYIVFFDDLLWCVCVCFDLVVCCMFIYSLCFWFDGWLGLVLVVLMLFDCVLLMCWLFDCLLLLFVGCCGGLDLIVLFDIFSLLFVGLFCLLYCLVWSIVVLRFGIYVYFALVMWLCVICVYCFCFCFGCLTWY